MWIHFEAISLQALSTPYMLIVTCVLCKINVKYLAEVIQISFRLQKDVIVRMKALTFTLELTCFEKESHRSWMGQEPFDIDIFQTSGRFQALTLIHTWIVFLVNHCHPSTSGNTYYSPNADCFLTAPFLKNRSECAPKPQKTECSQMLDASQVSAMPLSQSNSIFNCSSFARLEKKCFMRLN